MTPLASATARWRVTSQQQPACTAGPAAARWLAIIGLIGLPPPSYLVWQGVHHKLVVRLVGEKKGAEGGCRGISPGEEGFCGLL